MQRWFLSLIGAAVLTTGLEAQTLEQREREQQQRIRQGVASGELTRREAAHLERKERQTRSMIRHDRRDGYGLTAQERAKAQRRLNQNSRAIAREKHDNQVRP